MTNDEADAVALSVLVLYGRPGRYWFYDRDGEYPWGVQVRAISRRDDRHDREAIGKFSAGMNAVIRKMHPGLRGHSAARTAVLRALQRMDVIWLGAMRDDPNPDAEESTCGEAAA